VVATLRFRQVSIERGTSSDAACRGTWAATFGRVTNAIDVVGLM
jgi:hypothetical protein